VREEAPKMGGNIDALLTILRCTIYAALHHVTSSKRFYAHIAAMQRRAGPVAVARETPGSSPRMIRS
jgi:hypothetical protein